MNATTRLTATLLWALALTPRATAGSRWSLGVFASEGLPDKHVVGVTQTADGWLWLATPRHLLRFDGVRFEAFDAAGMTGGSRRIRALLRDGESGLWLSTDEGLVRLGQARAPAVSEGVPAVRVDDAAVDGEGAVWLAYRGGVVYRVHAGRAAKLGPDEGVPELEARAALTVDDQGRVWLLKGGRVLRLERGRFVAVADVGGHVAGIGRARGGGVWIAAPPRLLRCREDGTLESHPELGPQHHRSRPSVLYEDRTGALWIGTTYSGLVRYHEGRFEDVATSHPGILCLFEDREGNLWVGTAGGGLNRIQPKVIELEGAPAAPAGQQVQSIAEDADGVLWGARPNGEVVFRRGEEWRVLPSKGAASAVAVDPAGALFVGTRTGAFHRFEGGHWRTWGSAEGLTMHTACIVLATPSGDVWLSGTGPGTHVQRLRAATLRRFDLPPGRGLIRAMAVDAAGDVWMGVDHGVLLRARGDGVTDETPRVPGADRTIRSLHAAADGTLWIGYDGGGLARLKDGRLTRFTAEQGLPGETVAAIFDGGDGRLWLATDMGFLVLRPEQLEAVAAGRSARIEAVRAAVDVLLPSQPAAFCGWTGPVRARDGRVFVPLGNSLAVVHPSRQPGRLEPPPVQITRVVVDGVTAAFDSALLPPSVAGGAADLGRVRRLFLPPRHRRLEIDVAALSLHAPENVRLRHRLEGLDDTWIEQSARQISYTRLPAGPYRLQVTACGSDGTWNPTGAALEISVAPFAWQTWWFQALAFVFTGGLLAVVVRAWSLRRLRARLAEAERQATFDRERTRIARDIHDDVGNQLTRITLLGELARRDMGGASGPAGDHVREIGTAVQEMTEALDQIVWAVDPGHDTLPHLLDRMAQLTVDCARPAGITARLDLPARPPERALSAEVRHNLLMAFKEALTNAVRHSRATTIEVAAAVTDEALSIVVRDDGRGFTPGPASPGADGLRNMQGRLRELGGDMEMATAPGSGTRVTLRLPWPPEPPA